MESAPLLTLTRKGKEEPCKHAHSIAGVARNIEDKKESHL